MVVVEKKYTVKEFLDLDDFEQNAFYELIHGEIVKKSSPAPKHQLVLKNLVLIVDNFVKLNQLGTVLFAPVDVFLDEENLFVPDMLYISTANKHIITDNGIEGVPDLVVEILSPSTAKYDRGEKMKVYKRTHISEYWIIDPKGLAVEVYSWNNGDFDLVSYAVESGKIESVVLKGLEISAEMIFNVA